MLQYVVYIHYIISRKNINFEKFVRQDNCRGLFNKYTCNTLYLHFHPQYNDLHDEVQTNKCVVKYPFWIIIFSFKENTNIVDKTTNNGQDYASYVV